MRVAIPSADPDDQRRRFEMKSFEIVSKETGEAVSATITRILWGSLTARAIPDWRLERGPVVPPTLTFYVV